MHGAARNPSGCKAHRAAKRRRKAWRRPCRTEAQSRRERNRIKRRRAGCVERVRRPTQTQRARHERGRQPRGKDIRRLDLARRLRRAAPAAPRTRSRAPRATSRPALSTGRTMFPRITPARRPSTRSVRASRPRGARDVERELKDRVELGNGDAVDRRCRRDRTGRDGTNPPRVEYTRSARPIRGSNASAGSISQRPAGTSLVESTPRQMLSQNSSSVSLPGKSPAMPTMAIAASDAHGSISRHHSSRDDGELGGKPVPPETPG